MENVIAGGAKRLYKTKRQGSKYLRAIKSMRFHATLTPVSLKGDENRVTIIGFKNIQGKRSDRHESVTLRMTVKEAQALRRFLNRAIPISWLGSC